MQLIIGSAQFGRSYGIQKKKISKKVLEKIYYTCKKNKINFIDTAQNYGESEKLIGRSKLNKLKIITKLIIPKKLTESRIPSYLEDYFKKTISKLGVENLYAVLIHDISIFNNKNKDQILKFFNDLKKRGLIKFFGASVYSPTDLKVLFRYFKPDLIQFPLNIFDQRFLKNNLIKKLKKKRILLASRSCFLQGFLLQQINYNPKFKLKKFYSSLKEVDNWCVKRKISRLDACIHFVKKNNMIDYMVVGYDDISNLKNIIISFKKKQIKITKKFKNRNKNLIDPRKWKP